MVRRLIWATAMAALLMTVPGHAATPVLSPGISTGWHGGDDDHRFVVGLELSYIHFDLDAPVMPGAVLQVEGFSDESVRLALAGQLAATFVGIELGGALRLAAGDELVAYAHIAPWVGVGLANIAVRLMPGTEGFDFGVVLTIKLPTDLEHGVLFNPFRSGSDPEEGPLR